MDPPQRLAAGHPVQGLQAQRVLTQRERALVAERALAQPGQVGRLSVVGTVDDAQVLPAAHLQARLEQPAVLAGAAVLAKAAGAVGAPGAAGGRGEVSGGLDHHALSPGGGQVLPPARRCGHGGRIAGLDGDPAGRGDQVRVGGGEPVGHAEMPQVRALVVGGALGREQLERGDAHARQLVGGPAVAQVGGGERVGVRGPGAGPGQQGLDLRAIAGQGPGAGLLEHGRRDGQ